MPKKKSSSLQPQLPHFDDPTPVPTPIPGPFLATNSLTVGESVSDPTHDPLSLRNLPPVAEQVSEISSELLAAASAPSPAPPIESSHPKADSSSSPLVIVVDSHSLIYQVFHALPAMTSPDGGEVGAVHGFLRDIANLLVQWKPEYLVCAFDESEVTFRNELYAPYKAHREAMPEALRGQIGLIQQSLDTLHIPRVSLKGFEADDILATLAHQAEAFGAKVLLVTSDKDCRQLITPQTSMLNVRKNELFGAKELLETWAIRPDQVVDFQSLVGDSVDNVPGVPSIGPKAAQQLLAQFDSLDRVYENIDQVPGDKKREKLIEHRESAMLSRSLVKLKNDCPIPLSWPQMRPGQPDLKGVDDLFRELGFRRLAETFLSIYTRGIQGSPGGVHGASAADATGDEVVEEGKGPAAITAHLSPEWYRCIESERDLDQLLDVLRDASWIAIDTETTSTRPRDASLVGLSVCWAPGHAAYIPILSPLGFARLPLETVRDQLAPLLAAPDKVWIGQHIKFDAIVLKSQGMPIRNIAFDTMVADYLLDAGGRNHGLGDIAKRWLDVDSIPIQALIGNGKSQRTMDQIPLDQITRYACEDVDIPLRLHEPMRQRLESESLLEVMDKLEIPLIEVLADMEFVGVRLDTERLSSLDDQFGAKLECLRAEIMELAGQSFNPDSPKQLAAILFDKFRLRVVKKTKTGPSTDAEVLEELASEHPLPAKILEYRQLAKLQSTYVEALPKMISATTGRVHTSFRQDIAATGRLSSIEPNLQNIPVRTAEGRSIRSAFIPGPPGWQLLTADYSQIELRVLAHCSEDPNLCDAFRQDADIHASVASLIHGVPLDHVTSAMRRSAKAVSFGILYGQSPFGLAKGLGISRTEAGEFIDQYFARYPQVRAFIANTLIECRERGFVTTMAGRKRTLKGIRDFTTLDENKKKQLLEPERMAVNTVIQGSAADMIKFAMIRIARRLKAEALRATMLLQIHDELVFEVAPESIDALSALVREEMTEVMPLRVPLKVDIKTGVNWSDCEPI